MLLCKAYQKIKEVQGWPLSSTAVLECDKRRKPGVPASCCFFRVNYAIPTALILRTEAMLVTKHLMIDKSEEDRDKSTHMPSKDFRNNPEGVYKVRKGYSF